MLVLTIGLCGLTVQVPVANAVDIQFDYSFDANNFFDPLTADGLAARAALEATGEFFESFTDSLGAIVPGTVYNEGTPSEFTDTWTQIFTNPATGSTQNVLDVTLPADVMTIYVGGRDLLGTTAGIGGSGGFTSFGISAFVDAVQDREQGTTDGPSADDFGPWGGAITFDTLTNWNFGINTLPAGDETDFLSVTMHELAHVFGFGTSDVWVNQINFIPNPREFTGPASVAEHGGDVLLASGSTAHWNDTVLSDGRETAMNASITQGDRKLFTPLDRAAMTDIGWQVPVLGDLNFDGNIDDADIDHLFDNLAGNPVIFDLSGNGLTGLDDVIDLVEDILGTSFGDADLDGFVNLVDLNLWLAGGTAQWSHGDFDGDGNINLVDLNIWLSASPPTAPFSPNTIPEPATLWLLVIGGLALRRRHRL